MTEACTPAAAPCVRDASGAARWRDREVFSSRELSLVPAYRGNAQSS